MARQVKSSAGPPTMSAVVKQSCVCASQSSRSGVAPSTRNVSRMTMCDSPILRMATGTIQGHLITPSHATQYLNHGLGYSDLVGLDWSWIRGLDPVQSNADAETLQERQCRSSIYYIQSSSLVLAPTSSSLLAAPVASFSPSRSRI